MASEMASTDVRLSVEAWGRVVALVVLPVGLTCEAG
jgi:hypothetical protein